MQSPKAALFDLDDTLAESFRPPAHGMIERLLALLEHVPVAIISAAGFARIETEFLDQMAISPHISRFYVFPNSASQCFIREESGWRLEYSLDLSPQDRAAIQEAISESLAETGIIEPHPKYAPQIIDRETQVAFTAMGFNAETAAKSAWDPDQSKRRTLKQAIERRIPDFEVLIGGKTTIDVTHKGVDKAYGVNWLSKRLGAPASDMLYVGDALYEGGNDAVVIPTGIQTRSVTGPDDTAVIIDELLAQLSKNTKDSPPYTEGSPS
jgi:HAD superfamily hydrolase (TIGR01484 family)